MVEGEGFRVLNETDCKLGYADLQRLGQQGIDIGFYMFSGANWYPMMYDYPDPVQVELVRRRRQSLLRSLVQRVKLTRPRFVVPAAGPCTVLDPDRLWLNSDDRGIFIDPREAVAALQAAGTPAEPVFMAATDVWDSQSGYRDPCAGRVSPAPSRVHPRASERMAPEIRARRAAETPAGRDLPELLVQSLQRSGGRPD